MCTVVTDPPAISSRQSTSDPCRHPPQTYASDLPQTHFFFVDPLQVSSLYLLHKDAWGFDLGITSKNGYNIKECGIFDI